MSGTLATGTVIRSLTAADLNIPAAESGADAQRAAILPTALPDPSTIMRGNQEAGRDAFFALLTNQAAQRASSLNSPFLRLGAASSAHLRAPRWRSAPGGRQG
jgi:hypothetical protein